MPLETSKDLLTANREVSYTRCANGSMARGGNGAYSALARAPNIWWYRQVVELQRHFSITVFDIVRRGSTPPRLGRVDNADSAVLWGPLAGSRQLSLTHVTGRQVCEAI